MGRFFPGESFPGDSPWDSIYVSKYEYQVELEEWEGVPTMMGELSQDAVVTTDSRETDCKWLYEWKSAGDE